MMCKKVRNLQLENCQKDYVGYFLPRSTPFYNERQLAAALNFQISQVVSVFPIGRGILLYNARNLLLFQLRPCITMKTLLLYVKQIYKSIRG